jgi:hypothetical protein
MVPVEYKIGERIFDRYLLTDTLIMLKIGNLAKEFWA